jgi:hypothetical protein
MKALWPGLAVLFGSYLALNAYAPAPRKQPHVQAQTNADAAMTPDSGTSGVGDAAE